MKRKVAVITGTRADYGIYYYVLKEIESNPNLELKLIVCGMHLCPEFGMTVQEIEKDGFHIEDRFETILASDTGSAMGKSIGLSIIHMAQCFERIKPDVLLILGDRGEMLAGAIAASHMNIPVAHIHGGEVTGTIDESVRHAVTKLSHIHFASTEDSAQRITKLGEVKENVFVSGAPGLDYIKNAKYHSREEILNKFNLKDENIILLTQHPVTTEREVASWQISQTLEALVKLGLQTIISYPNSDNGGREMIKVIEEYRSKYDIFKVYKNITQEDYLNLLNITSVMVGNSSSGIIEAASFKLPVVNIGTRQNGRLRANNVIDCDYDKASILKAINISLNDTEFKKDLEICVNPYGEGKSSKKIVDILANINIDKKLIQKKITY